MVSIVVSIFKMIWKSEKEVAKSMVSIVVCTFKINWKFEEVDGQINGFHCGVYFQNQQEI